MESTNSDNKLVSATEDTTKSNNNSIKRDNNNNETTKPELHPTVPVSSDILSTTPNLTATQNQETPAVNTCTDVHPTTTNVEPQPQQLEESTESTKPQETVTMQQPIDLPETNNTEVNASLDVLQGKMTPEKIAIETLLNMGDSMEYDDHSLDKNALLMPVDRPPDIPIEPKGTIPTQPVNPELPPEPKLDTPLPSKGNDTDSTEILEAGKHDSAAEGQQETIDAKTTTKKKKKKTKKTDRKTKKKKSTKTV